MAISRVWKAATEPSRRRWCAITIESRSPPDITPPILRWTTRTNSSRGGLRRFAEGLDHSHRQRVIKIRASFQHRAVGLQVHAHGDAAEDLRDANRSAELFEKEFHGRLYFRRAPA